MPTVAVAGGTGHIGRTLVEAIQGAGKHKVLILSRQPKPELEDELGVPIIVVDYSNVEALANILEAHDVHIVVSALTMMSMSGAPGPSEIPLIRAVDASKVTKRIVSSDWGFPHTPENAAGLSSIGPKLEAQAVLKTMSNLVSTVVQNGYFMDYWGVPVVKSYMQPSTSILDIPNAAAGIPGTGNEPIIFSHTTDVAKFVAALLDSDEWDPVSYVVGDKLTWNEFLGFAEDVRGVKFDVAYDDIEKLRNGEITELPGQVAIYPFYPKEALQKVLAGIECFMAEGAFNYETPTTLNEKFPNFQPIKVKDMLQKAWSKA
ncbi:hypothetical protein B0J13DRAFT_645737 [Dactylonectria estremocensis]|uniref:NmrA-like domain-containing protein n=1 Tax=Dactylonectria estremocensis TaxID=1079267 RepID=A0A9P9DZ69_9HYPO|nr:hypothetical protein B0J13DRAFT_645737 [Dactylonectria estremocensis]